MQKDRHLNRLVRKGVGWRVEVPTAGDTRTRWLGYSHPIQCRLPAGVRVQVRSSDKEGTLRAISGPDARRLGDFTASLRRHRPFNPYTGHGLVRLDRPTVARKAGKRKG